MTQRSFRFVYRALLLATAAMIPGVAGAITVDGRLDPSYARLNTQTTQTFADATQGLTDFADGSELDAAYGAVDNGVLYLFFAGNLKDAISGIQAGTDFHVLEVFIDSQAGGQNTLLDSSAAGFPLAGLTFDSGLAPDYSLEFLATGALDHRFLRWAYFGATPTSGGGAGYLLGTGSNAGAPGTLAGGTNPFGILATIDNGNSGGVGPGCGAASGAGVTSGVELAIPLAAIGNPANCIRVSAFVYDRTQVTNQALGSLPAGTCGLGPPASVNFEQVAGAQYFAVCSAATSARRTSWWTLKTIYR